MRPIVLIPARLRAVRLPGKPLADIHGELMIVHVWRRAVRAGIGPVVVACEDMAIAEVIRAAGGTAELTGAHHQSGSDRIFEALQRVDAEAGYDVVVNVQGDLPAIEPAALAAVLEPLADQQVDIATLASPLTNAEELADRNVVKVAAAFGTGRIARAAAFTRDGNACAGRTCYHHIGIYAYRRAALARFVALAPSLHERAHSLEQLRALEAGMIIGARLVDTFPLGVDTPADLDRVRALLAAGFSPPRTR